jgi:hypothetical protein
MTDLSKDIWAGKYGYGRGGVLARARCAFYAAGPSVDDVSALPAYASALYSAMTGSPLWKVWYCPLRLTAFLRLYFLLQEWLPYCFEKARPNELRAAEWTPARCETMAAILSRLANAWCIPSARRRNFGKKAETFAFIGYAQANAGEEHTLALLMLQLASIKLESDTEEDRKGGLLLLDRVAQTVAPIVPDANHRSRCFRKAAELYFSTGYSYEAHEFIKKAERVPCIDESVRRKNERMRQRMRA